MWQKSWIKWVWAWWIPMTAVTIGTNMKSKIRYNKEIELKITWGHSPKIWKISWSNMWWKRRNNNSDRFKSFFSSVITYKKEVYIKWLHSCCKQDEMLVIFLENSVVRTDEVPGHWKRTIRVTVFRKEGRELYQNCH